MPIRSALQQRKAFEERQAQHREEALAAGTRRVLAEQQSKTVVPSEIGRLLGQQFPDKVVRSHLTFARPLKTRNPRTIRQAYAMHMFGDYFVPAFIQKEFLDAIEKGTQWRNQHETIAINLFFAVRNGKSVWKEVTRNYLSKRETHELLNIKHSLSIRQAFVYTIALQDCDRSRAHAVATSRIGELFIFGSEFWREVIRFFARNPCDRRLMNDILDFIRTRDQLTYSMKGRTIATLHRAHEEWVREAARTKELGDHTWPGISVRDLAFSTREGKHEWLCFQIKDSKELGREGTKQRHCVSSYRSLCCNGSIGIFSLRRRDRSVEGVEQEYDRCLTIEVSFDGKIRQVRGFANRSPEPYEDEAMHYWAAQNGMHYNPSRLY